MLKVRFIGRGMHLEFKHPEYETPIVTSRILEIRECARDSRAEDFVEGAQSRPAPNIYILEGLGPGKSHLRR